MAGTVQVDETYIGGEKPGKRGRGAEGKAVVMIAVEDKGGTHKRGIGRIRLKYVDDASGASILPLIQTNVNKHSQIRTDGWHGYNTLTEN